MQRTSRDRGRHARQVIRHFLRGSRCARRLHERRRQVRGAARRRAMLADVRAARTGGVGWPVRALRSVVFVGYAVGSGVRFWVRSTRARGMVGSFRARRFVRMRLRSARRHGVPCADDHALRRQQLRVSMQRRCAGGVDECSLHGSRRRGMCGETRVDRRGPSERGLLSAEAFDWNSGAEVGTRISTLCRRHAPDGNVRGGLVVCVDSRRAAAKRDALRREQGGQDVSRGVSREEGGESNGCRRP